MTDSITLTQGDHTVVITSDASCPHDRRITVNGSQWTKVYGWSQANADNRARTIAEALLAHLDSPSD